MERMKPKLLIIDDQGSADYLRVAAGYVGFDAVAINDASQLVNIYSEDWGAIVLDMNMSGMDGVEILRFLGGKAFRGQVVIMTANERGLLNSAVEIASAHGLQVSGALQKPIRHVKLQQLFYETMQSIDAQSAMKTRNVVLPTLADFQRGLDSNDIVPYFQPQIDIRRNKVVGVEALVRWQHPELGLFYPNVIIPMAEEGDFMSAMTQHIMEQSMDWAQHWKKGGLNLTISINMSASSIVDLSLPDVMESEVQRRGLGHGCIVLEVTEQTLMTELSTSLDILTRLRMKHLELSIDDFGTGHSSMLQLYRVPFTEIKIDRSFISKLADNEESYAIVEMTIALAHKLKMRTVAEGVEDAETLATLKRMGCDLVQGYYYAKPMPGDEIMGWCKNTL